MMMKMPWRRKSRSFHLQLQGAIGTIQSPFLFLFTNYSHSSTSTLEDARFFTNNFKSASFTRLHDAIASFNHVIHMNPLPSRVHFNRFLSALVKMKQYHSVLSMSKTIELLGISHDVYSLSILINCFCHLHLVDFGFSVFGKMLKFGLEPTTVTFNSLINGLCMESKIDKAVEVFDDMVARGYQPDVYTYSTIIKGMCKFGKTNVAIGLLKGMADRGCEPNVVTYGAIIDALCKDELVGEALELFSQMRNKGISPDVITYTGLIHGVCKLGQKNQALALMNEMVEQKGYKVRKSLDFYSCWLYEMSLKL
uniref:Pentacotripeptide-repeat region of PRORP domain-containing protein n=1 Tax=Manihot esculenta TaxID=3983 RepID=A0A199UD67_MANES